MRVRENAGSLACVVMDHHTDRQHHELGEGRFYCPQVVKNHKPLKNPEGFCITPLEGEEYCSEHCVFNLKGNALEAQGVSFEKYEKNRKIK
ncbi:MAG: hypothetical protein EOM19_01210 [Candidatus Moranbacteria bacterium]|nr:hypothetical protein [Candidatus Moranbacteria bacterium]